ncbi:trans-aconitate 2-methyltransferase [Streptomyces sp. 3MP-14]|uniref:Trans-aconitate 2-methyltransferase n=1 Tax=Streptomyces mimosae TaxID=2586635 RepID=A0A5N6A8Q8_9ACTN|nr:MULTISPECIES: trans-aconitate 2-methyltransferase [Streptomyces]KAB8164336.1 trans-aconitate 2-methyltransferase [Streptomyces mimosae]KAB8176613.1 trans-aconitate 2-methyltransferase [Streptomyces sp. 3MP-14]
MPQTTPRPRWDPAQCGRHAAARSRPLTELLARVPALPGRPRIADLGCGPGAPTLQLFERWPDARVTGYDNSPEMLAEARRVAAPGGALDFVEADLASWRPAEPFDLIVSNAALQWVPEHPRRLADWVGALAPGGALAFQVPRNFAAPSHALMRQIAERPRWRERLAGVLRTTDPVLAPEGYLAELAPLCAEVDVWETTYLHRLTGEDPVLDWVRGTGLRPVITALEEDPEELAAYLDAYRDALRAAYPPGPHGTVFPFRRIFVVGRRAA